MKEGWKEARRKVKFLKKDREEERRKEGRTEGGREGGREGNNKGRKIKGPMGFVALLDHLPGKIEPQGSCFTAVCLI